MPAWFLRGLPQPMREIAWGDFLLAALVAIGLPVGMLGLLIMVAFA